MRDIGCGLLVADRWSLVAGYSSLVAGPWFLVTGRWHLVAAGYLLVEISFSTAFMKLFNFLPNISMRS